MLPLILIFGPIAIWLCILGWAICKAASHGDAQLDCDPPEPEDWIWPEYRAERIPPCFPARHELRSHHREAALLSARRGDR